MQMQVEAERKKRAAILESEGTREAEINVAEGKRQSRILASEAEKQEQINKASGEACALVSVAEARAKGLLLVAESLKNPVGKDAASLSVAEQYVQAFNKLARTNNTLILPSDAGDVSTMVAQALSIYKHVNNSKQEKIIDIPNPRSILPATQHVTKSSTTSKTIPPVSASKDAEYYSDDEAATLIPKTTSTGTENKKL